MKGDFIPKVQRESYEITNMIPFYHLGRQYLDIIKNFKGIESVLIIGIGDGLLPLILKEHLHLSVDTADIDKNLNPDYLVSVHNLSSKIKKKYDLVICSNVLEHLPFDYFSKSLREINKVTKRYVLITLPYAGFGVNLKFTLIHLFSFHIVIKIPYFLKRHRFNGEHYWEIGTKGYPLSRIKKIIKENGFKILTSYLDKDWDYCYHFLLIKVS